MRPDAGRLAAAIGGLVVVGRCGCCGCDPVDFQHQGAGSSWPIADGLGRTAGGWTVGVLVFATAAEITCLEIHGHPPPDAERVPAASAGAEG